MVLNDDAERSFHDKYRWIEAAKLDTVYSREMLPFDPVNCDHCVFTAQNEMVDSLISPNGMENFI